MSSAKRAFVVGCLGIGLAACETARDPGLAIAIEEARLAAEAPGAIVGVRYADGTIQLEASGVADVDSGRAMRAEDAFLLGSVSKTYTAALILRLAEERVLAG